MIHRTCPGALPSGPAALRRPVPRLSLVLLLLALFLVLPACSSGDVRVEGVKYLVGVSQANLSEPWRIAMVDEIRSEAERHPDLKVLFTDASDSPVKQTQDINSLLDYGVDLLIVSPSDAQALTPVVGEAWRRIPVIILDRAVEGYEYTLYIGPDNESIGRRAGEYVSRLLGSQGGRVLLVNGVKGSPPTVDREAGFRAAVSGNPRVEVVGTIQGDWLRDRTHNRLRDQLRQDLKVDVIFAQNDAMANGASMALSDLGMPGLRIIGVDGLPGPNGGLDLVQRHKLEATFTCPTGGREAIAYAMDILQGVVGIPKKVMLRTQTVTREELGSGALKAPVPHQGAVVAERKPVVLGFVQVGAESHWRLANTASIKEAAARSGIDLRFADGQQNQHIQMAAIRQLIKEKVDVIAFSPRVESGWEEVLSEAKAAGIPVILTDRSVDLADDSLWVTFLGSDFVEEGRRAARWITDHSPGELPVGVVQIMGTPDSAPTIDRDKGFREILARNSRFQLLESRICDFTFQGGKKVMHDLLTRHGTRINVVFSQNDDMALGAIEAMEEAGFKPGTRIKVVSIDAIRKAFEAMIDGKLNCTVECTPLLGPLLMKAVRDYMDGKELPARIIPAEEVFPAETAARFLPGRKY